MKLNVYSQVPSLADALKKEKEVFIKTILLLAALTLRIAKSKTIYNLKVNW